MELTVNEALSLKNEVQELVNDLFHRLNMSSSIGYGETYEINQLVEGYSSEERFSSVYSMLSTALEFSLELNNVISTFNIDAGISGKVRQINNNEKRIGVLRKALSYSNPKETSRWQMVENKNTLVKVEYRPYEDVDDLKAKIKVLLEENRELQSEIYTLNGETVEVSFDYSDIEELQAFMSMV